MGQAGRRQYAARVSVCLLVWRRAQLLAAMARRELVRVGTQVAGRLLAVLEKEAATRRGLGSGKGRRNPPRIDGDERV